MPVQLADLILPEFGLPTVEPAIPASTYRLRLEALKQRARQEGYEVFVVYADREHFANLTYLTGYDPRFEESLLLINLTGNGKPLILVGNEGLGYVRSSPIIDDLEVVLFQSFSLLGQPRTTSQPLADILALAGIKSGTRVGVAGWKHFSQPESATSAMWLEIPSYIVDTLRQITRSPEIVRNANAILMDSSRGLRAINDVDQIAWFEFAGTYSSQALRDVLFGLKPGLTEYEAFTLTRWNGIPLSCHAMLSSGERAFLGMGSPSMNRIQRGDPFTMAFGLWGGLNARAGFVVAAAAELPAGIQDYVEKLVAPYFGAIVAWYERVGIGVTGGDLYDAIHTRIGDPFFGVGLNPGHLIHLDEWLHSPIYKGSTETLQSGMALQVDVIPATGTPYFTTNIEDGLALADENLRAELASRYPDAWARIQARRAFMHEELGITLKPEVLPLSNIPAYLPPFLLAPSRAMRCQ
ncbi:MAG TPA: aminopeptidase P family N-terminal domain-containing protein [Aggregatilineaceae bacterium]|nr:aminopeptidase P family N-terminal domain-containing protein [Aggregatilineaceae bacterium]